MFFLDLNWLEKHQASYLYLLVSWKIRRASNPNNTTSASIWSNRFSHRERSITIITGAGRWKSDSRGDCWKLLGTPCIKYGISGIWQATMNPYCICLSSIIPTMTEKYKQTDRVLSPSSELPPHLSPVIPNFPVQTILCAPCNPFYLVCTIIPHKQSLKQIKPTRPEPQTICHYLPACASAHRLPPRSVALSGPFIDLYSLSRQILQQPF